jgi:hypothetical protein
MRSARHSHCQSLQACVDLKRQGLQLPGVFKWTPAGSRSITPSPIVLQ